MKFLIRILFLLAPTWVLAQNVNLQSIAVLAGQYYQNKEYGKAAELYEQLYTSTKSVSYFNIYFECLLGIPDYERAEKEIKKGLRGNSDDSFWYVQWGFLKKTMGQPADALKMYNKAIALLSGNQAEYPNLANQFINRREFEFAEKVYLKGREIQNQNVFSYELARVYYYMRNYEKMLDEYLEWAKQKETNLDVVKSSLQSVLSLDNDHEISDQLKTFLLKRIQSEPEQLMYNRLLIWFFIQDKNFSSAIRQSVALDKRIGGEDGNIFGLANISASNRNYQEAEKAYNYLIEKGKRSDYYQLAKIQLLQMQYDQFSEIELPDANQGNLLKEKFDQTFKLLGLTPEMAVLLTEYAHLLAFYLDQPTEALTLLSGGLEMKGLNLEQLSILKMEQADVNVYAGNLWDAVITYSQVIESNKNSPMGDDVKFRKAKLGYYMGNFQWVKAQLDALRASTSKLIANDAMELSLFINENLEADSTAAPLRIFARADLQLFRNHYSEALVTLDSISAYPYNSLADDVNFRKAGIFVKQGKYTEAAALFQKIVSENSWDRLADDALFQLAGLYQNKMNKQEEAMELYKKILTDYPGSIYVVDSRAEFRKIQEKLNTGKANGSEKNMHTSPESQLPNP